MSRKKLGAMLVESGLITEHALRTALGEQRRFGGSLGRTVVELKLVSEPELVRVLALQLKVPVVDLDKVMIAQAVLELVPGELAHQHQIVPFAQPMKFLDVAMADPTDVGAIDALRIRTQLNIRPHLAGPKMIERAVGRYYARGFAKSYQRGDDSVSIDIGAGGGADNIELDLTDDPVPISPMTRQEEEIADLVERVAQLERRVELDVQVLQKIIALLVDKRLVTREEIVDRLRT